MTWPRSRTCGVAVAGPNRESLMIRYRKLGYVELNVSDLERSRRFYQQLVGLQLVGSGPDGGLRFRCSDDPYNVVLHQASEPGYKRAGWMLEDEDQFTALHRQLRDHNVDFEALSAIECSERGFRS